MLFNSFVASFL